MTSKNFNPSVNLCLIGLVMALFSACQSGAERDRQRLEKDPAATADLRKINYDLQAQKLITPENFEKLKALRLKYPDSEDIEQTLKSALTDREDWETLESLLKAKAAAERKPEDNILLAQVLIKRGKYEEGLDLLSGLELSTELEVERRSIASIAYFNMGDLAEAAANLDAIWEKVTEQKRVGDINLRGMIYFRNKEYEKAISTFERSLSIDPDNPSASSQLSRVYSAMGDAAQAEKYRQLSSAS
ncbi:MAG: tetratricopeptide repeat protein, partial [Pyrinomonadaceae bacterium]